MDYLKLLTNNAFSKRQLFHYLKDAEKELRNGGSIFKVGHLFNVAYGLDLSLPNTYKLGHYIATGDFLLYPEKFRD